MWTFRASTAMTSRSNVAAAAPRRTRMPRSSPRTPRVRRSDRSRAARLRELVEPARRSHAGSRVVSRVLAVWHLSRACRWDGRGVDDHLIGALRGRSERDVLEQMVLVRLEHIEHLLRIR